MRRIGKLWPRITAFENLLSATAAAARGKRTQRAIARFLLDREPVLLALQRELVDESYRPGPMSTFVIHDPKLRTISVAPFRDRVVHHAVIDVIEPFLDRRLAHASFACRKHKGPHAALDHAQRLVRRHRWFLKMDVEKFFASLRHDVVTTVIARIVKDPPLLRLLGRIIAAGGSEPGMGLPVGNLTSQWLANLALRDLDRLTIEQLRVPGYVRYMDDFVIFDHDPAQLKSTKHQVEQCLESLYLRAKASATMIGPTGDGLPFLGFQLFPAIRRVRPTNRRRVVHRWKHRLWQWRRGELDEESLADAVRSMMAHLEHGTTRAWRRRWCTALEGRGPM